MSRFEPTGIEASTGITREPVGRRQRRPALSEPARRSRRFDAVPAAPSAAPLRRLEPDGILAAGKWLVAPLPAGGVLRREPNAPGLRRVSRARAARVRHHRFMIVGV